MMSLNSQSANFSEYRYTAQPNEFEFVNERNCMKKYVSVFLACLAMLAALPASAQFAKPDDAIKYRKNALFVMQQNFSRVAGMAAGKIPFDAKVAAESAAVADFVGKLPWAAFGPETESGDTKAKPEIWGNKAKFDDYAKKLQAELSKLDAAAKAGKLDSIKVAVNATGEVCKACHDDFRSK
jgi:cytochrome c556